MFTSHNNSESWVWLFKNPIFQVCIPLSLLKDHLLQVANWVSSDWRHNCPAKTEEHKTGV